MQNLYIREGRNTPEIKFSPEENIYIIRGTSSPEDVRALYYPVTEWFSDFSEELKANPSAYPAGKPLVLKFDLNYFNSSSAKFIYDIIVELKNLQKAGIHAFVEWHYEADDPDMLDAGKDISGIAGMEFRFVEKG